MKRSLAAILVLSTIIGAASAGGAAAAVHVGFSIGNVAIGYSDGYWDRSHHWHGWGPGEAARFRAAHRDAYHEWRHDDRNHH